MSETPSIDRLKPLQTEDLKEFDTFPDGNLHLSELEISKKLDLFIDRFVLIHSNSTLRYYVKRIDNALWEKIRETLLSKVAVSPDPHLQDWLKKDFSDKRISAGASLFYSFEGEKDSESDFKLGVIVPLGQGDSTDVANGLGGSLQIDGNIPWDIWKMEGSLRVDYRLRRRALYSQGSSFDTEASATHLYDDTTQGVPQQWKFSPYFSFFRRDDSVRLSLWDDSILRQGVFLDTKIEEHKARGKLALLQTEWRPFSLNVGGMFRRQVYSQPINPNWNARWKNSFALSGEAGHQEEKIGFLGNYRFKQNDSVEHTYKLDWVSHNVSLLTHIPLAQKKYFRFGCGGSFTNTSQSVNQQKDEEEENNSARLLGSAKLPLSSSLSFEPSFFLADNQNSQTLEDGSTLQGLYPSLQLAAKFQWAQEEFWDITFGLSWDAYVRHLMHQGASAATFLGVESQTMNQISADVEVKYNPSDDWDTSASLSSGFNNQSGFLPQTVWNVDGEVDVEYRLFKDPLDFWVFLIVEGHKDSGKEQTSLSTLSNHRADSVALYFGLNLRY